MLSQLDIRKTVPAAAHMESICNALAADFQQDNQYRCAQLSMTASENYPSRFVRSMGAAMQGAFYEFAPPYLEEAGEWHFPDSGAQASLAHKLVTLGQQMFKAETFDWRPNGGATAEQAVLLGCCSRGDGFVHFAHSDGGHTTMEELARKVGIAIFHLPVAAESLLIDVDALAALVEGNTNIRLVILDQSFKLRWQPLDDIRARLPRTVTLAYDASHDGGLILGGMLPQPLVNGADILLGNSHKTIPGPQKGYIAFAKAAHPLLKSVSDWVCPYLQSNCHAEQLAPFYLALTEMSLFGRAYAQQVTRNAKALALALHVEGLEVAGQSFGFTETHQVLVCIGNAQQALFMASQALAGAGIRCNNIEMPGAEGRHGLRFGVQALTRRGLTETHMEQIARFIARAVRNPQSPAAIKADVDIFLRPSRSTLCIFRWIRTFRRLTPCVCAKRSMHKKTRRSGRRAGSC